MCQMVSGVCGPFTGAVSSFFCGGWEQVKSIGEIAKKSIFCDFRGACESFSSTNFGGRILLASIVLASAGVIYQMVYPSAGASKGKETKSQ